MLFSLFVLLSDPDSNVEKAVESSPSAANSCNVNWTSARSVMILLSPESQCFRLSSSLFSRSVIRSLGCCDDFHPPMLTAPCKNRGRQKCVYSRLDLSHKHNVFPYWNTLQRGG